MPISYRSTSIAVVLFFVAMWAVPESLTMRPRPTSGYLGQDVVTFDPCMMWEQIDWQVRLATLVWFGTALAMFIRGLRNRTVPRAVALVSLLALVPVVHHDLWRMNLCESRVGVGMHVACVAAVLLMTLQHLVGRKTDPELA